MLSGITPAVSLFHLLRSANTGRLVLLLGLATIVNAQPTTKLMPETVEAFDQYVEAVEELMSLRYEGKKPFLWLNEQERTRAQVIDGEIVTHQFKVDLGVPNGRLRDWVGAMFVSNVSVQQILKIVQDYDRHKDVYPEVSASRLIDKEGDVYRGYLRITKKKVLTAVLDTDHEHRFFKLDDKRWHSRSYSTRIQEVRNAGQPDERLLPVEEDSGFMWRLYSYWRLEQDDDGVFAELQSLSLSRRPPRGLGWLIRPFIRNMPRDALEATLQATRVAAKQGASKQDVAAARKHG